MKRLFLGSLFLLTMSFIEASIYQPCANGLAPCPEPTMYFDLQTGGYRLMAPGFSFGETIGGGGVGLTVIDDLAISHDRITGFYPRIAAGFEFDNGWCPCHVGDNFYIEIGLFYSCFEKSSNSEETIVNGIAFPSITGDGDFLFTPDLVELSGISFRRKYEYGGVQGQFGSNFFFRSKLVTVTPYLELDVNSFNQAYEIRVPRIEGGVTAVDFFLKEKLTTTYWDFGGGLNLFYRCSPACRTFFFFAQATGFLSHAETELHSVERVVFPLFLPLDTRIDECIFSGKARGQLGIGYFFGTNVAVSIMAQIDYWGYVPRATNPHRVATGINSDGIYDGPARITKTSLTNYALVFELTVAAF